MTDEVFTLAECFPRAVIKPCGEIILNSTLNLSFTVKGVQSKENLIYKLLEWGSRPIAKGMPYSNDKRNRLVRRSTLLSLNQYLKTNFTEDDIWLIYDMLGNAVNHNLTVKFVECGFDMDVIREAR